MSPRRTLRRTVYKKRIWISYPGLETHLLDYGQLAAAHCADEATQPLAGPALLVKPKPDFERFLEWQARRVAIAASKLAQGEIPKPQSRARRGGRIGIP